MVDRKILCQGPGKKINWVCRSLKFFLSVLIFEDVLILTSSKKMRTSSKMEDRGPGQTFYPRPPVFYHNLNSTHRRKRCTDERRRGGRIPIGIVRRGKRKSNNQCRSGLLNSMEQCSCADLAKKDYTIFTVW